MVNYAIDGTLTSRCRRAHTRRLVHFLSMGPMEFKAVCWTANLGPFAPSTKAYVKEQE